MYYKLKYKKTFSFRKLKLSLTYSIVINYQ